MRGVRKTNGSATVTASRTYSLSGVPVAERDTNTAGTATVNLINTDIDGTADLENEINLDIYVRASTRLSGPLQVAEQAPNSVIHIIRYLK
jgi:hypothetical protein